MTHHFGDALERDGGYWTMTPNAARHAQRIGDLKPGGRAPRALTIGKGDRDWRGVLGLPSLEELTLHEPSAEQIEAIRDLPLKRLRVTHARVKDVRFLADLPTVEELVLEYVSGFDDLSPVGTLPNLRALHLENLRKVSSFDGLAGAKVLRYLAIHGTLDWKQPIESLEFLGGLPQLEMLGFFEVKLRAPFPATLPMVSLPKLRRVRFHNRLLRAEEYALLEVALPEVDGVDWGAWRTNGAQLECTGLGSPTMPRKASTTPARCAEHERQYAAMKEAARAILAARHRSR